MADSNLNTPVIVQATRLDTSILPRNIFSQSYLLYVIAQGTDVGNVANKANEAGQGAYDAQVRNDEQDVILVDHEERIRQLRIEVDDHEIRIAANTAAIAALDVRLTTAEGEIVTLQADVSALDGRVIRQNNDIERSGANNVGLTALQGLSGIAGVFQQEKQAQRQKEFQQAYANAYASGDRGALRQLATQYPDQIESVRKGMGFIDEDQRNSIGTLAAGARLASSGIRRAAGNRLEQVQNAMAGVNIQPARAIQQIDTEISNLQKLGKVADNETISKLQSYRDELVRNASPDGPVNLDLKQLSDLRSQFRMDVKGERPVLPNRSDAAIQRVYKAMTDDINGAIGQNLGNDTLRKYQQANAVYADEAAKLKNTRLKNVLMKGDLTPEVVNNMLFSKNKSEIKTLYNSVGRVGRAQMRNGIIGKAMEKSGGSPDQFLRQLNILQKQTGITFKGQDASYLKGLKNYLQSTQQAAKAAVTTPTGQQTIPFIIGYGTAMNPATTGAAVSYGLLTRAYESEPFRNAMLRMANTPRGSTAFDKAMQQAQKAINAMTQGAKSDALSE